MDFLEWRLCVEPDLHSMTQVQWLIGSESTQILRGVSESDYLRDARHALYVTVHTERVPIEI